MTRKIVSLCLMMLLLSAIPFAVFADDVPTLVVGQATGEVGGTVSIPVSLSANGSVGIGAISALRVIGDSSDNYTITGGKAVAKNSYFDFSVEDDGKSAMVTMFAPPEGSVYKNWESGTLFNIEVKGADGVSGTYPVSMGIDAGRIGAGAVYYTSDGSGYAEDYPSVNFQAGSVTFEAAATPTPTATPSPTPSPTPTTAPTATVAPTATTAPTATVAPTATTAPTATVAPTATTAPTATPSPTPVPAYKMEPNQFTWDFGKPKSEGISMTSDVPFGDFKGVYVGGNLVSPSYYKSEADGTGTKITLDKDFLNRLAVGSYDLRIQATGGSANGTLKVTDSSSTPAPTATTKPTSTVKPTATAKAGSGVSSSGSSPKTGDETNVLLWVVLLVVSTAVCVAVVLVSRKRKNNN